MEIVALVDETLHLKRVKFSVCSNGFVAYFTQRAILYFIKLLEQFFFPVQGFFSYLKNITKDILIFLNLF